MANHKGDGEGDAGVLQRHYCASTIGRGKPLPYMAKQVFQKRKQIHSVHNAPKSLQISKYTRQKAKW